MKWILGCLIVLSTNGLFASDCQVSQTADDFDGRIEFDLRNARNLSFDDDFKAYNDPDDQGFSCAKAKLSTTSGAHCRLCARDLRDGHRFMKLTANRTELLLPNAEESDGHKFVYRFPSNKFFGVYCHSETEVDLNGAANQFGLVYENEDISYEVTEVRHCQSKLIEKEKVSYDGYPPRRRSLGENYELNHDSLR